MKNKLLPLFFISVSYLFYCQVVVGKTELMTYSTQLKVNAEYKEILVPQIKLKSTTHKLVIKPEIVKSSLVFNTKTIAVSYYYSFIDRGKSILTAGKVSDGGDLTFNPVT